MIGSVICVVCVVVMVVSIGVDMCVVVGVVIGVCCWRSFRCWRWCCSRCCCRWCLFQLCCFWCCSWSCYRFSICITIEVRLLCCVFKHWCCYLSYMRVAIGDYRCSYGCFFLKKIGGLIGGFIDVRSGIGVVIWVCS